MPNAMTLIDSFKIHLRIYMYMHIYTNIQAYTVYIYTIVWKNFVWNYFIVINIQEKNFRDLQKQ